MLKVGAVVRSIAGRDKDRFYLVVKLQEGAAWVADGKLRKLAAPKRKNVKHLSATRQEINLNAVATDKKLRGALAPLNDAFSTQP